MSKLVWVGLVWMLVLTPGCNLSKNEDRAMAAKNAFANLVKAAKESNLEEARKYFSKAVLKELEETGQLAMSVSMLADMNFDNPEAEAKGDKVILTKKHDEKVEGGGSASTSLFVTMVKEDGQWKVGKK